MTDFLECIPILYLLFVWFTPTKFDMSIFIIFCGIAAVFFFLDIIRTMAENKKKVKK